MYRKLIFDVSTLILSGFCLFPAFTGNNFVRLAVLLSCTAILTISMRILKRSKDIPVVKILFVLSLSLIISYIFGITHSIYYFVHYFVYLMFIPVYLYYRYYGWDSMKRVVYVLLILLIISAIQTVEMLNIDASYARSLTKNQEDTELSGLSGGYGLVYALVLSFLSLVIVAIKSTKRITVFRVLTIAAVIAFLVFIWKAGFFLALLLLVGGSILLAIGVNRKRLSRTILLVVFSLVLVSIFEPIISNFAIQQTVGTKYERKVAQILLTEQSTIVDGEFQTRNERYVRDLKLMIDYPIVGCWDRLKVGKHSFLLDTLAQFGLIFGGFLIFFILFIPYRILKYSDGLAYNQAFVFFGALFLFLLLNSMAMAIAPIVFIIFPYTNYLLKVKP